MSSDATDSTESCTDRSFTVHHQAVFASDDTGPDNDQDEQTTVDWEGLLALGDTPFETNLFDHGVDGDRRTPTTRIESGGSDEFVDDRPASAIRARSALASSPAQVDRGRCSPILLWTSARSMANKRTPDSCSIDGAVGVRTRSQGTENSRISVILFVATDAAAGFRYPIIIEYGVTHAFPAYFEVTVPLLFRYFT